MMKNICLNFMNNKFRPYGTWYYLYYFFTKISSLRDFQSLILLPNLTRMRFIEIQHSLIPIISYAGHS